MLNWLQDLDPNLENLDPSSREILTRVLNHIEVLSSENQELRAENQRLKDEIARLKGHKGKPDIKPNRQPQSSQDSDKGKRKNQSQGGTRPERPPRNELVKIDREQVIKLDRSQLPKDVTHRGYREVTIQNIVFKTDTVVYRLERLYSESSGQFYEAQLPVGLRGQSYGNELAAFVLMLYFELRVPQEKILKLLQSQGIVISAGKVSDLLSQQYLSQFTQERNAVLSAGLASTTYQQIDDTGMRVNGENWYAVTLCNPHYSSFFTTQRKNFETVSQLLSVLETPQALSASSSETKLSPSPEKPVPQKQLGDYINILVGDDAGQFHNQTQHRSLCWIHEGRHYEKLTPVIPIHQQWLDEFLKDFWAYYHQLKAYQQLTPPQQQQQRQQLSEEFDRLFSRAYGYDALDHRIALTRQKKQYLLLVLDFPQVPLDNNEAERALREYVVKRKISNGTRTQEGTQAWEVFLALVDTCRKHGVNFYQYLLDRISQVFQMPALANLILEKSQPHPT
jgi:hypothetical protein